MLKGQSAVAEEIHFNYRSIVSPFRSCSKDLSFGKFLCTTFQTMTSLNTMLFLSVFLSQSTHYCKALLFFLT